MERNREKAKERSAKWYEANKDKVRERLAKPEVKAHRRKLTDNWRVNNYAKAMWSGAKSRAGKENTAFNLEVEDIIIPPICPILGIELSIQTGSRRSSSPSIDRIINTKSYTKDNIHIISFRANRIKSDASLEELVALGEWAKNVISRNKS